MIADYFKNISFAMPQLLLLLLMIPVLIYWYVKHNNRQQGSLKVSSAKNFAGLSSWINIYRHIPFVLRLLTLTLFIIAMARPQNRTDEQQTEGDGVDIILCLDVSGSMTAQDFTPNRMEAAKKVAIDFINSRITDRIGIVIFSGESFTQCPITTDKPVLIAAVENIHNGLLEDGTSIGDGLATSVDRLRGSKSKSKVVILLTDGENNGGLIGPANAKEIAKAFGVKVYTIGVGTDGYAPFPIKTPLGVVIQQQKVTIDEKLLTEIANETGARYFRAKDNAGLQNIYASIDSLEKSKVTITQFTRYTERFFPFVLLGLLLLLLEMILRFTVLKKFP